MLGCREWQRDTLQAELRRLDPHSRCASKEMPVTQLHLSALGKPLSTPPVQGVHDRFVACDMEILVKG